MNEMIEVGGHLVKIKSLGEGIHNKELSREEEGSYCRVALMIAGG